MNKLTNRNPFADFDNLFRTVERNLESAWHGTTKSLAGPHMDIYEKADALYIRAALPGVHEEDLELVIDRKVVTMKPTNTSGTGPPSFPTTASPT